MYIRDIYKNKKPVISLEVFPPKKEYDVTKLYNTIEELKFINPDFVSVTYGAGGGTKDLTVEIASKIKNQLNIETVAHLTCVNSTKDDIKNILDGLNKNNVKNILALRGDPPQGSVNFSEVIGEFKYAYQLIDYIKKNGDWSIAAAGYPEFHLETKNKKKDIEYLKIKADMGADIIITQLFFNNNDFYSFIDIAYKIGITIPIVPGIFPILSFNAIKKISSLCGAKIPEELFGKLEKVQDKPDEIEKIGIEYAIKQSLDLLENNVHGLHFYSMNKSEQLKKYIKK